MDHVTAGHPGVAAISLLAAMLGIVSGTWGGEHSHLFGAMSPDDVTAWAKAIAGALFVMVNSVVGCWNLIAIATGRRRRPRAKKDSTTLHPPAERPAPPPLPPPPPPPPKRPV